MKIRPALLTHGFKYEQPPSWPTCPQKWCSLRAFSGFGRTAISVAGAEICDMSVTFDASGLKCFCGQAVDKRWMKDIQNFIWAMTWSHSLKEHQK